MTERGTNGQFLPGNKQSVGNKGGRPRRSTEERFLKAFSDTVKTSDIKKMVEVIMVRALCGDVKAARFIMEYAVGKPMQYITADIDSTNEVVVNVVCHEGNVQHQSTPDAPEASGDQT